MALNDNKQTTTSETATTTASSDGSSSGGPSLPPAAGQAVDKAKDMAMSQLSGQKAKAADAVSSMAESLRKAGEGLEQSQSPLPVHQYVNRAAEQLEQLGSFLNEKEMTEVIGEVENFARRQPALFLGAAFAAGLVAARFLRSSGSGGGMSMRSGTDRGGDSRGYGSERRTEPVAVGAFE
jgi:hypothetical protein